MVKLNTEQVNKDKTVINGTGRHRGNIDTIINGNGRHGRNVHDLINGTDRHIEMKKIHEDLIPRKKIALYHDKDSVNWGQYHHQKSTPSIKLYPDKEGVYHHIQKDFHDRRPRSSIELYPDKMGLQHWKHDDINQGTYI